MKLYDYFNSIAGYFWKKALTPKQKKLPKGLQEAILKKQKPTKKKKGK